MLDLDEYNDGSYYNKTDKCGERVFALYDLCDETMVSEMKGRITEKKIKVETSHSI